MAEQQQDDGKGKVSIGEALEAIRSGKKVNVPKKATAAKPSRKMGRPTATFWVRNLQESVQRRMDHLYDAIRDDPGAMSQMRRRDFFSSERFSIPLDAVSGVVEVTPGEPPPPPKPLSTFQDLKGVDVGNVSPESVPRSRTVNSTAVENGELAGRQSDLEKMDLSGHLRNEASGRPAPGQPNDPRFAASSNFDTGRWIIEEIRATPRNRGKKLKVNPLIRKMFEKRGDGAD